MTKLQQQILRTKTSIWVILLTSTAYSCWQTQDYTLAVLPVAREHDCINRWHKTGLQQLPVCGSFIICLVRFNRYQTFATEKAMTPHSSTFAWKIPWTEEPGGLQSMGSQRVRHDWATSLSLFLSCIGEGNGNPLQCSCLENPRDRGAWWLLSMGFARGRTRLKQLSSLLFSQFSSFKCTNINLAIACKHPWISEKLDI